MRYVALQLAHSFCTCKVVSEDDTRLSVQGCFWGVEHYINKKFNGAILKSAVGYTGGEAQNPKCAPCRSISDCNPQMMGSPPRPVLPRLHCPACPAER